MPFVKCYYDDITVFSQNEEEHLIHLQNTLEILAKNGIKLNKKKSQLNTRSLDTLGYHLENGRISPIPHKKQIILNWIKDPPQSHRILILIKNNRLSWQFHSQSS